MFYKSTNPKWPNQKFNLTTVGKYVKLGAKRYFFYFFFFIMPSFPSWESPGFDTTSCLTSGGDCRPRKSVKRGT